MTPSATTKRTAGPTRARLVRIASIVDAQINAEANNYYGNRAGFCDQCNGIFAHVARILGYPAVLVRGYVGAEHNAHTWARVGNVNVDVAGAQFGRPQVRVFTSDPQYHAVQTEIPGERIQPYPEDEAIILHAVEKVRNDG